MVIIAHLQHTQPSTRTTIVARKETVRRLGIFKLETGEKNMDNAILRLLDFWDAAQTETRA